MACVLHSVPTGPESRCHGIGQDTTLTVSFSTHTKCKTGNAGLLTLGDGLASHAGGLEIILVTSCYRNLRYATA